MIGKKNYDYLLRIIVIGESKVGKTSLILRYTDDIFPENNIETFNIGFLIKTIIMDDNLIKVQTWDPCKSNDRPGNLNEIYYETAHGIIITYDITNKKKFIETRKWIDEIIRQAKLDVRTILVGNKYDLSMEREVTEEEGKKLAAEFGMLFFETSAKTGYNVNFAFETLVGDIIKNYEKFEEKKIILKIDDKNNKNNRCIQ